MKNLKKFDIFTMIFVCTSLFGCREEHYDLHERSKENEREKETIEICEEFI